MASTTSTTQNQNAHGGDGVAIAKRFGLAESDLLDLSASLNPFAPDVAVLAQSYLQGLKVYPDSSFATGETARVLDVAPDRLILTNGGAEAIAIVAATLKRGQIIEPEFALYQRHLAEQATSTDGSERWRSNPNNPLGHLAKQSDQALVWDEAFYPLATGTWSRGDNNAWRVGSFTKLWACPGLRIGYIIAPDAQRAQSAARLQPQWPINNLALALIPELLALTDLLGWAQQIAHTRKELTTGLEAMSFRVTESTANWVLVHDVLDLKNQLIPYGLIVRDCTSFGLPNTYRIAVPHPDQLDRTLTTISRTINPKTVQDAT